MAKRIDVGNKASLRARPDQQLKRIESISSHMGPIGDFFVSTWASILLSMVAVAAPIFLLILVMFGDDGTKVFVKDLIPMTMIIVGAILLALNVFFVHPTRGDELLVSLDYWFKSIHDDHRQELLKYKPMRFYKRSLDHSILEAQYKGHKHYLTIIKVQGTVSRTSFDADLAYLHDLNKGALEALEKDTERTIVNFIGQPKNKIKPLALNASPAMQDRAETLHRVVKDLGEMQSLETYVVLDSRSVNRLMRKVSNQFNFFNRGLVVSARVLKGKELKQIATRLFC